MRNHQYPRLRDRHPPPYGQPTAGVIPGAWSAGLCDCLSDFPNCCITCCCPCITFGQIAEVVDQGSTSCVTSGALYALLALMTGCGCMYSCLLSQKAETPVLVGRKPLRGLSSPLLLRAIRCVKNRVSFEFVDLTCPLDGKEIWGDNRGVSMAPMPPGGMST